ncbi:GDNF-inducible zinc finger protein 1-like [Belonocnema kinseyi]|uniref:GDNF-inducible zinc finger protein 1-like n=1 Tax=Belonocnema kinseyi TaxID=2817044 RepID=UPI00143CFE53|nr:GDNF-inducible zinc finger protein 1-like [Belonocnema kinseyi]
MSLQNNWELMIQPFLEAYMHSEWSKSQKNWVTYELKSRDVETRFFTCEQLIQRQRRKGFLQRIVIIIHQSASNTVKNSQSVPKKATERRDGGPSCTPTEIISKINFDAKTSTEMILFGNDKTLKIKEGIIQVQETAGQKCKETHESTFCAILIEDGDNLTAKEKLWIPEMKLIQESTQETRKNTNVKIKQSASNNVKNAQSVSKKPTEREDGAPYSDTSTEMNCNTKTSTCIIEYDHDETLEIKEGIIKGHQSASKNAKNFQNVPKKSTERKDGGPSCTPTEISSKMNSNAKTSSCIIVYDNDETLEIKEGIIQAPETTVEECNEIYESTFCAVYIEENDNLTPKEKLWIEEMKQIQESTQETGKDYKCEKCAKTYKWKRSLTAHQKFGCDVVPKFKCKLCEKRFKRQYDLNNHVHRMHQKTNSKKSNFRHTCDKCFQSYCSVTALSRHRRLSHAAVIPQFFCDICGIKMNRKSNLVAHIATRHSK